MVTRPVFSAVALLLASLSVTLAAPSAQSPAWQATHNSSGGWTDAGKAVAVGVDGSVYVTGYAYRDGAEVDFVTIKYNTSGRQVWAARYDGPAHRTDIPTAIGLDAAGNVYVAGRSVRPGGNTTWDYVLVKYLPDGRQHWARRQLGSPQTASDGDYTPTHLVVASDGSAYLSGIGGNGFVITKYAANGDVLWKDNYGPTGEFPSLFASLAVMAPATGGGGVFLAGKTVQSADRTDLFVVRYTAAGKRSEFIREPDSGVYVEASAIVADGVGGCYVAGTQVSEFGRSRDMLIARFAPDGSELWSTTHSDAPLRDDVATAAAVDPQGNLVVSGYSSIPNRRDSSDLVTLKFNAAGGQLWSRSFDGPIGMGDRPAGLAIDAAGRITLAGTTGLGDLAWIGGDYLIVRYGADGSMLNLVCFDGRANFIDMAAAVALDRFGNAAVTGVTGWQGSADRGVDSAIGSVFYNWQDPPSLEQLGVVVASAQGGDPIRGAVQLSGPIGTRSAVELVSSRPEVIALVAVRLQKGSRVAYFTLRTRRVSAPVAVTVSASFGGVTKELILKVRP